MTFINKVWVGLAGATFTALVQVSAAQAGVLGGSLFSTGGGVWASILGGEAGLTSHLSLYSPHSQYIANNREVGKVVYLGQFAVGQELLFGISNGNTFLMGPGSRNADGLPHAPANKKRSINPGENLDTLGAVCGHTKIRGAVYFQKPAGQTPGRKDIQHYRSGCSV